MKQTRTTHRGSAMLDAIVVIGIVGLLVAIVIPMAFVARERASRAKCANHLREIGKAMTRYASDNNGLFPSTRPTRGPEVIPDITNSGAAAANPFADDGPGPNNVPSVLFLLVRTQKLDPADLLCPAAPGTPDHLARHSRMTRSNFSDPQRNLGYSVQNPYANDAALEAGFRWTSRLPARFALVADRSPGAPADPADGISPDRVWNSDNHGKDGQNILFANGSVHYEQTPFAGVDGDNIYTNRHGRLLDSPADALDSLLLPAQ